MEPTGIARPAEGEFGDFHRNYVALVPESDIIGTLEEQQRSVSALLRAIPEEKASHRYEPGKWSVSQIIGHLTDAEQVFAFRALSIARGETAELPGFDENAYVASAGFDDVPVGTLVTNFQNMRESTLGLLRTLPSDAWTRTGTANRSRISVRAIAWIVVGHMRHHLNVLRERYGVA